jgi:hypothetical protein
MSDSSQFFKNFFFFPPENLKADTFWCFDIFLLHSLHVLVSEREMVC